MQPTSMSGADAGSFTYDGNYRRVKQVINGETIYSVYGLSGELLYRDNASTGETTDYVNYAGGVTFRFLGNGEVHTVASDHLGSPIVANRGIHRQIWREDYTPHGEPRLAPAANDNEQGFTGHIADTDTGLTYMQARYYDPVIGRFLSPDPVGFASGGVAYFNRYAYVANDPVNAIDPDGREPRRPFPSPSQRQEIRNNRLSIERNREPIRQLGQDINAGQTQVVGTVGLVVATVASGGAASGTGLTAAAGRGALVAGGADATTQFVETGQVDPAQTLLSQAQGAVTGLLFGGGALAASNQGSNFAGQVASGATVSALGASAIGVIEGVKSILGGGSFQEGFGDGTVSAIVDSYTTQPAGELLERQFE